MPASRQRFSSSWKLLAVMDYVDPFYPSFYGFIRDKGYWPSKNVNLDHYKLGASTSMPDPKGTPEWNFRPRKEK